MNKTFNLFLLSFYTLGTFCLPLGDFTMLDDIPGMYRQCKATEDEDMSPFEFVTNHLLSLCGQSDKHHSEAHQKPHAPLQSHHRIHFPLTCIDINQLAIALPHPVLVKPSLQSISHYRSDFSARIFHPPLV